jgi:saccharopine dehydrogenase (NAD+, L-lysine-forming)
MEKFIIGIIREGKVPPDFRVPLSPEQCAKIKLEYPSVDIIVQPSPIRCFKDQMYVDKGITVQEDLSSCDLIMGVKEVPVSSLIPNKRFMFFSHTIKKQSYNRKLLQEILSNKIQLIDYEVLKNKVGKRLIGFGRYAGIVGCYNGFRALGLKLGTYELKKASECFDRKEMEAELSKVVLDSNLKIVATGFGRVGFGAREILDLLPIIEVSPEEFLNNKFDKPVFTHLEVGDYYARKDNKAFHKKDFYENPSDFKSIMGKYIDQSDMYIACHYWSNKSPNIVELEQLQKENLRLKVVADISCDIAGPIATTIRPSTIAQPIYGFNPMIGEESDFKNTSNIAVMAVDNLPCELPKDASEDFGNDFIQFILPNFFNGDPDNIIGRGSETTLEGELTEGFKYLEEYVVGN